MLKGNKIGFPIPPDSSASPEDVIALLDTQSYFELLGIPYPTNRDAVLERLQSQDLIQQTRQSWTISNLAAILLAKKLDAFSLTLARKAPRVVIYEGINKLQTRDDKIENRGYAVGFEGLVDFVHSAAPQNRFTLRSCAGRSKDVPETGFTRTYCQCISTSRFSSDGRFSHDRDVWRSHRDI